MDFHLPARPLMPHAEFEAWVRDVFPRSVETAGDYQRLAALLRESLAGLGNLDDALDFVKLDPLGPLVEAGLPLEAALRQVGIELPEEPA